MRLNELLAGLGVGCLLHTPGGPTPGGPEAIAPDLASAALVAQAEGTMGSGLGAVLDGEVLTLLSRPPAGGLPAGGQLVGGLPDGDGPPVLVADPAHLIAEIARARRQGTGALSVRLGFDPADLPPTALGPGGAITAPAEGGPRSDFGGPRPDPSLAARFPTVPLDGRPVDLVLAGRGVIRAGAVEALRALAEGSGVGVLNTFTAKGLFRWDSPYHLGTGGLQELDLALAGGDADGVVLTVGLDRDEFPDVLLRAAAAGPERLCGLELDELAAAADVLVASRTVEGGRPALYRDLAAVVQPLYQREAAPLNPARAAADIAETLPGPAAVWAEPGRAALWVARALPTTRLGSVRVPPAGSAGVAVAGALGAALRPGGVGVAVVDALAADGVVPTLLDWAATAPGTVVVEIWGDGGDLRSAPEHRERLAAALARPGVHLIEVPVDFSATSVLTDVCGPAVAWPGQLPAGFAAGSASGGRA